jgi:hypothetical protein
MIVVYSVTGFRHPLILQYILVSLVVICNQFIQPIVNQFGTD